MESLDRSLSFVSNMTNSSNDMNSTVAASIILPRFLQKLQAITYIAVFIVGLSLNIFLIILILSHKSLRRQKGFIVSIQILFSVVAFAVPVLSLNIVAALEGDWTLGDGKCQFIAFCTLTFQPIRWFLTTAMVIDRALTISWPFKYEKYRAKLVAILSVIAYILGLISGIIPTCIYQDCIGYVRVLNTCHLSGASSICGAYNFTYTSILFSVGGILPFCLYLWMFYKAGKANNRIVPAPSVEEGSGVPRNLISRKQLLTFFVLFWTLLGCALPHYLSYLLAYISFLTNFLRGIIFGGLGLAITQPLYYGLLIADPVALMWNVDVKKELRKIKSKVMAQVVRQPIPSSSRSI